MKKLLFVFTFITALFITKGYSQEERNKIEMTITHKGKTETCKVYNVSYYFSRPTTTDSSKKMSLNAYEDDYYLTVSLDALTPTLLQMVADPQARVNGTIIMKDNYTDKQLKEIKFYEAQLNNFSESLSNYSYGNSGSSSLSIMAGRISIDGVAFQSKR